MRIILILLFTILTQHTYCQQQELEKYLRALKPPVSVGAKKIMKEQCFDSAFVIYNRYDLISFKDVKGAVFPTDLPGVKVYKATFVCKIDRGGDTVERESSAVLYYDKTLKKWLIYSVREKLDHCSEFNEYKKEIDGEKSLSGKQSLYGSLAFWGIMCGKLSAAKKALLLARKFRKPGDNQEHEVAMRLILAKIQ